MSPGAWKSNGAPARALILIGGAGAVASAALDVRQFAFSWLLAFLFFLSASLGALFLLLAHHLFDAAWSTPLRRVIEHTACFAFPWLAALFLPVGLLAGTLYPGTGRGLFWAVSAVCLGVFGLLSRKLRRWSVEQDASGAALCSRRMRAWSARGALPYALALTVAAGFWIEAVSGAGRPAIGGVWFFAASAWVALFTVYALAVALRRAGPLRGVLRDGHLYYLGSLALAFTIFWAYISYCRFFIVWNGNLPAETGWEIARGQSGWRTMGLWLIVGHFAAPFLVLLRSDWKSSPRVMLPLCVWAWAMHGCDLEYQIMPALHPDGPCLTGSDAACLALFAGLFWEALRRALLKSAPYPARDPRLAEALGHHAPPTTGIATAPQRPR